MDRDFWNDSYKGDYLWSNVNFGEAVTEVMTPLTWSVIRFTLADWIFLPGMPTVGVIGGRPYLNISIFATLFNAIGRSRQDLLSYMEPTLYLRLPEEMPIPAIPVSRKAMLAGLFCSLRVQLRQRRGTQNLASYLDSNVTWFQDIRQAIQSQQTALGLLDLWHARMAPHVVQGVWCVLGSVSQSTACTMKLRHQLVDLVGPQDANILIANLSEGQQHLDSLGLLAGLDKLGRGEITRAAYLEHYGHRGPHEFELSVPRPAEDPTWLNQELEKFQQSPVSVEDLMAKQRRSFEAAWKRLERQSSKAARLFKGRMAQSAQRARLREQARSAYVRDRWAIRLLAVRAGALTTLGDQVFYLTLEELLRLLSGDRSVTAVIPSRQEAYQQYKALPPYPSVIRGRFDPFTWAADSNRPRDIFDGGKYGPAKSDGAEGDGAKGEGNQNAMVKQDSRILVGSPGSTGVVEGIVRVIDHPQNGDTLRMGEIMVAVQTDIAWTLLFPRVAAVITDIGAPLSHAAIVARELGIPAVVGCGNATTILKTGDRVRVDGANGVVSILGPPE